jgi:iron complex transport system substrate-binding protein
MWRPIFGVAVALLAAPATAEAGSPRRVVSMNLCTDQLAMLIAAEGQLHSVSYLASDASSSVLASSAGKYAVNHGLAEEVFLMKPDLVIAGTYSTRATVALLRRLGIRVEEFAPEQSFDDVRNNILRMGDLLDRRERASELVDHLDRQLAELDGQGKSGRTVATYYANSYTSGSGTLVDAAIQASGLTNMAASLGLAGTARLPLEVLVLSRPDLLVDGEARYTAPALANENFTHPAYRALAKETASVAVPAKYTICGAPFTAEAARLMRDAADAAAPGNPK